MTTFEYVKLTNILLAILQTTFCLVDYTCIQTNSLIYCTAFLTLLTFKEFLGDQRPP